MVGHEFDSRQLHKYFIIMAKNKSKLRNCSGGLWWVTRPINKMNNNELDGLGKNIKKFIKRYSNKKNRVHGKTLMKEEL